MPTWIAQTFLNSSFVTLGTVATLVSLPILIHLINRLRFRRVRWAAMEFLLKSQQRNRRRLLLEQLLLLLLRIAAVLGLLFLIARPILDSSQLSIFQGLKAHHLVLLDDSGSMRDRWGDKTNTGFANGLDVIRKIAAEGSRRPGTQSLTLLLLSNPNQPVITQRTIDESLVGELETRVKNLTCTHRSLDLVAAFEASRTLLTERPGATRHFHFISDFRQRDWDESDALATVVRQMDTDKVSINLVRTVPTQSGNLAVTKLAGSVQVAAAKVPLRLTVGVKNLSEQVAKVVRLSVFLDGKKLPRSVVIEQVEAGAETTREFDVEFATSGPHEVRVSLASDALEEDNTRFLAIDVAEGIPVLIVDGDPAHSEAFYLQDALAPAPGVTGFAPSVETVDFLRRHPVDRFQSIILLNVAELPPDSIRLLESFVSSGGGLTWFLGNQVRAAFYNDKLHKSGQGLFPAKLATIADLPVDDTAEVPDLDFSDHPIFRVFAGEDNPFVDSVKVNQFFTLAKEGAGAWQPADGVQVIARLRNKAPVFLEHQFGRGTVITCLSSLGGTWNNWPRNPSFVVAQLELEKYITRGRHVLDQRVVGEPIRVEMDATVFSPQVTITLPDGTSERTTAVVETPTDAGVPPSGGPKPAKAGTPAAVTLLIEEFENTDQPGVYTVRQQRLKQGTTDDVRRFAYNFPAAESFLELADSAKIKQRVGTNVTVQIQEAGAFEWIHGQQAGQEVHDLILIILLIVLLGEQLLAMRLSFHPKVVAAPA
ncbi:MAG: BatA domain-containing protein [Planctomycetales bacterium]|nr:BatA domain-containing protein [Planctomycetales bacterium]